VQGKDTVVFCSCKFYVVFFKTISVGKKFLFELKMENASLHVMQKRGNGAQPRPPTATPQGVAKKIAIVRFLAACPEVTLGMFHKQAAGWGWGCAPFPAFCKN